MLLFAITVADVGSRFPLARYDPTKTSTTNTPQTTSAENVSAQE